MMTFDAIEWSKPWIKTLLKLTFLQPSFPVHQSKTVIVRLFSKFQNLIFQIRPAVPFARLTEKPENHDNKLHQTGFLVNLTCHDMSKTDISVYVPIPCFFNEKEP